MTTPTGSAQGLCIGAEMGTDPNTGALLSRSPRTQAAVLPGTSTPIPLPSANGLLTDPTVGLWTPQQSMWQIRQEFSGQPDYAVANPGSTWYPTIAAQQIVNPSPTTTMGYQVNLEWQVDAYCPPSSGMLAEVWGHYDLGTNALPQSLPLDAIMQTYNDQGWWHETSVRTVRGTVPPNGKQAVTLQWGFKNASSAQPSTPTLYYWRMSMIGVGFLVWPVANAPIA